MNYISVPLIDRIFFYGFLAFGALAWDKIQESMIDDHPNYIQRNYTVLNTFFVLPSIMWFLLPTNLSYGLPFYIVVRYGSYIAVLLDIFAVLYFEYQLWPQYSWQDILLHSFVLLSIDISVLYGLTSHFAYYYLVYLAYNIQYCYRWIKYYKIRARMMLTTKTLLVFTATYFSTIMVLFAYMNDPHLRPLGVSVDL